MAKFQHKVIDITKFQPVVPAVATAPEPGVVGAEAGETTWAKNVQARLDELGQRGFSAVGGCGNFIVLVKLTG